jgi:hypothetical protein
MAFGTKQVAGNFEVVDYEDDCVTVRHLATEVEYTFTIADGAADKFLEVLPLGTFFAGALEIEDDVHYC